MIPITGTRAAVCGLMDCVLEFPGGTVHTDCDVKSAPEVCNEASLKGLRAITCLLPSYLSCREKGLGPKKGREIIDTDCRLSLSTGFFSGLKPRSRALGGDVNTATECVCVDTLAFKQFKLQELCVSVTGIRKETALCSVLLN